MDGWLCFVRMDPKFTFLKLDVTLSKKDLVVYKEYSMVLNQI
jgi:hypothetical protein